MASSCDFAIFKARKQALRATQNVKIEISQAARYKNRWRLDVWESGREKS